MRPVTRFWVSHSSILYTHRPTGRPRPLLARRQPRHKLLIAAQGWGRRDRLAWFEIENLWAACGTAAFCAHTCSSSDLFWRALKRFLIYCSKAEVSLPQTEMDGLRFDYGEAIANVVLGFWDLVAPWDFSNRRCADLFHFFLNESFEVCQTVCTTNVVHTLRSRALRFHLFISMLLFKGDDLGSWASPSVQFRIFIY